MSEEFIEKVKLIHGEKYDYSKVNFINNLKEVIITCKIHGDFMQLPKTHKRGNGCIKCGFERTKNSKKSNLLDFINKAIIIHGDKYDYSKVKYTKASEKVIIICKIHNEFEQTPNSHLRSCGCVKCSTDINSNKLKKTKKEFINEAMNLHGNKYDYSKIDYVDYNSNITIICTIHGEFEQKAKCHLKSYGCKKCGKLIGASKRKNTTDEFITKAIKKHGTIFDYSKVIYINAKTNVIIICNMENSNKVQIII
jgi:hypothetical protein